MEGNMRHVEYGIEYEGKNITDNVQGDLLSFSYAEHAGGDQSDSLSLKFQNKSRKWMSGWMPAHGDRLVTSVTSFDWAKPGEKKTLSCGTMMVDDPEFSGPPDTFTLNALAIPAADGFSDTPDDRTWTSITMTQLGKMVASTYGLGFVYDAPKDFIIKNLKRSNQTDSDLLVSTAQKYNLVTKIFSSKIVLYDKARYEARRPITTIKAGSTSISEYNLSAPIVGTGYNAVSITYKPPDAKDNAPNITYTFRIAAGGKILKLNESVDDNEQAEMVAKAKLREANEKQMTGTFKLALDLSLVAAGTINLQGYGKFDGKYFLDDVTHTCGDTAGSTDITIHKCLTGGY